MTATTTQYDRISQVIHWVSALLILSMIPLGLVMHNLPDGPQKQVMYNVHIAIGLLVIAVTVWRLAWLAFHRWPEPLSGLSTVRLKFLTGTHVFLYVALVVMLISGVATILTSGLLPIPGTVHPEDIADVPPRTVHDVFSKLLIIALVIHLVGVVDYQLRKGDTFGRMGITVFRKKA